MPIPSTQEILLLCLVLCGINIIFTLFLPTQVILKKSKPTVKEWSFPLPTLSVVTYIQNMHFSLEDNLKQLLRQNHISMEVVFVNHSGSDEVRTTIEKVIATSITPHKVNIVDVASNERFNGMRNKKYAITLGVKAATNSYIILLSAQDFPISDEWAHEYGNLFRDNNIVISYNSYQKKDSLINMIYRYHRVSQASFCIPLSLMKIGHTTSGNCMGFAKETFMDVNGYVSHMHLPYGINSLLIKDVVKNTQAEIGQLISKRSTVRSTSPRFKEWMTELRKDAATAKHFKFSMRFFLKLRDIFDLSWIALLLIASMMLPWHMALIIISVRCVFYSLVMIPLSIKLDEKDLIKLLPLLELATIFFRTYILLTSNSLFRKKW